MKAVRIHEFGGTEVLELEDVPEPTPGPGEVLLRVKAAGLNHLDVDLRAGISRFPVQLPHIMGVEIVGEIAALGSGVEGWKVGERVAPFLLGGGDKFLGVTAPGGYAESAVAKAGSLIRMPESLSDVEAAATQVAFGTAFHMLFNRAKLQIGETVMINSVGSGIGSAAVQLAKLAGATVIGNASTDEKLARARELGLDVGINYKSQDVVAEVMKATDGRGVDVVFEHVGGESFTNGLGSLTFNGRLVTCGAHAQEVVPFDIIPFFRGQKSVIGSFVYDRDEVEKAFALAGRGRVKPLVDSTFPLDGLADAFHRLESRQAFGKVVIVQ